MRSIKRSSMVVVGLLMMILFMAVPAFADDAPDAESLMLGVTEGSAIQVGEEMSVESRFELASVSEVAASDELAFEEISVEKVDIEKKPSKKAASKPKNAEAKTDSDEPERKVTKTVESNKSGASWKSAKASWYGPGFYGNHTASGMVLKKDSMVIAHRTLAFGTRVEIRYNGKTVIGEVQDRGPFISGRIFDLGPGVAKAVGFDGVHTIEYRILGK